MRRAGIDTRRGVVAVLIVLAMAGLAACGEDTDAGADGGGQVVSVTVLEDGFRAPAIAPSGATFAVTNRGESEHTWTAVDGSFDTGPVAPGETVEITVEGAGEIDYECSLHPEDENGTIALLSD